MADHRSDHDGARPQLHAILQVVATMVAGAGGAAIAAAVDLPGGIFIGAMVGSAAARLLGAPLQRPPWWLRTAGRVVLGLTIGAQVTHQTLESVARAQLPVTAMIFGLMFLGLFTAWAISRLTRMALPTALCGSAPGALSGMVALADDLGGDAPLVASMHLVRLISVVLIMPAIIYASFGAGGESAGLVPPAPQSLADAPSWGPAILMVAGIGLGLGLMHLRIPAGDLLAGLLVGALGNAWLGLGALSGGWRLFSQWVVGAGIGATMTRDAIRRFRPFALAGGLMTVFFITSGLALGWTLAQISSLDLVTCVMGTSPGGAETMMILASEFGADVPLVTAMHVSRIVILTVMLPLFVRLAAGRGAGAVAPRREAEAAAGES